MCCENLTKLLLNSVGVADFLTVAAGGTRNFHWVLKGQSVAFT
jgi:hypothetical protein